jgi:cholesterol transport system auxiliary component
MAPLPPLVLAEVDASSALDGAAVLYRLAYSDAQQLRPYVQARWSMPPAQLLQQRLRSQLGQRRTVLVAADAAAAGRQTLTLRAELEEFSHLFDAPDQSKGLVRLRATLVQGRSEAGASGGDRFAAQRTFIVQRPAQGADAAHGVRALTAATDALLEELDTWVQQVQQAQPAGLPAQ